MKKLVDLLVVWQQKHLGGQSFYWGPELSKNDVYTMLLKRSN